MMYCLLPTFNFRWSDVVTCKPLIFVFRNAIRNMFTLRFSMEYFSNSSDNMVMQLTCPVLDISGIDHFLGSYYRRSFDIGNR